MNSLTIKSDDPELLQKVRDFISHYKGVEIVNDDAKDLKTYLEEIREGATEVNTIDEHEMKRKFFAKLSNLQRV